MRLTRFCRTNVRLHHGSHLSLAPSISLSLSRRVEYSANHTTNCAPSWWCDWWMSYLNYQIEHHLFPSMPQFRHPTIAPRVKALFEKHGLHYDVRGYFEAMADTFANLDKVGHGHEHSH